MAKRSLKKPAPAAKAKKPAPGARPESGPEPSGKKSVPESRNAAVLPFTTVGVGASAGGLHAFTDLLRSLPPDTGMAFVFVQHLHPKHTSILAELLSRETKMSVREVQDGVQVEANSVYVIPRDTVMCIEGGMLRTVPRPASPAPSLTIDVFFESLAKDQGARAVGIVLSGNESDGSLGLRAIKVAGGLTFAQTPASANNESMPRNAIANGHADMVGTPAEIAAHLVRISRQPVVPDGADGGETRGDIKEESETELLKIFAQLKTATGVDFQLYKRSTVRRRLVRRIFLNNLNSFANYAAHLRGHPTELTALFEDLLINVTEFFRDPEVFDALTTSVFSRLMQDKRRQIPIRIWVPGCSTGEEPYSIAIALLETLGDRAGDVPIHIFATDISEVALQKARSGLYPQAIERNVSEDRLRAFFIRHESGYRVSKRLREMCVFARQNLVNDPPFSNLDLISCRNLLIYLGPALQKRIVPVFHYALRSSGFLLLGSSEGAAPFADMFTLVDKKCKIYLRRAAAHRVPLEFAMAERYRSRQTETLDEGWTDRDLQREADRLILSRYSHAGVVIDNDMNIVQFRGDTAPFLHSAPGVASLNLMKMSRDGLSAELREAVQTARKEQKPVRRDKLRLSADGIVKEITLEVIPFGQQSERDQYYLVVFEEAQQVEKQAGKKSRPRPANKTDADALIRDNEQLRQDLQAAQDYLQSILEEHEAANEELRSANEEVLSANEELQSTNEELETAKEELQSTNEELSTLNQELKSRNGQLNRTMNDLANVLSNVNIPIVIAGNDLRIRRFTRVSEKLLNLMPTDVGRPVADISFNLDLPDLPELMLQVMQDLVPKTLEIRAWNDRQYSLRLRPYRTEENKIDGVVMVLLDLEGAERILHRERAPVTDSEVAQDLIAAQEEERRRLARELHDEFNQRLALLQVSTEMMERSKRLDDPIFRDQLQFFRQQVGELSTNVRRMAYRLHPTVLEDLGLEVALRSFLQEITSREGLQVNASLLDIPSDLRPTVATAAYRIIQEGLRNIVKHADGAAADVSVRALGETLHIRIRDNGPGFDMKHPKHRGLGLTSIEERARGAGGNATIRSSPGGGTEISVELPKLLL